MDIDCSTTWETSVVVDYFEDSFFNSDMNLHAYPHLFIFI